MGGTGGQREGPGGALKFCTRLWLATNRAGAERAARQRHWHRPSMPTAPQQRRGAMGLGLREKSAGAAEVRSCKEWGGSTRSRG